MERCHCVSVRRQYVRGSGRIGSRQAGWLAAGETDRRQPAASVSKGTQQRQPCMSHVCCFAAGAGDSVLPDNSVARWPDPIEILFGEVALPAPTGARALPRKSDRSRAPDTYY
jgi:hypothetical protein